MAYDPQQQRPEEQALNNNRESLNIRQPGETGSTGFDWEQVRKAREASGRKSVVPDPGIGLGDIARSAASAPLEMVRSGAQIFDAGNEMLDRKAAGYRSGESKPLIDLGVDPAMLKVMSDIEGNPLSDAGSAAINVAGKLAGSMSDAITSGYSEGAKQAAAMPFIEQDEKGNYRLGSGFFDKDAWMMNAIPTVSQLLAGGAVSKLGAVATRNAVENSIFNRLSKKLPEEAARQVAKETAERAGSVAGKTAFVGTMATTAQGSGGTDMREQINTLSFTDLMKSPSFQKAFDEVDLNPANASLSDTEKLTLARNQIADQAASAVTGDPKMLAINIAASTLGDHTLINLLTKKGAASGVLSGALTGAAAEGSTEFAQGAGQRYVQNQKLIDTAGQKIDPMKDVVTTGASNAVLGAGMGGAIGALGGFRGSRSTPESQGGEKQNQSVNAENTTGEQQPVNTSEVGTQSQEAPSQSVNGQFAAEEVAGAASTRTDEFRYTPAYLRQDPRIQGFAEDNDVQRALAEQQPSPTPDELIQQQMESGDQGYTPEELAAQERADQIREALMPRLPPPGKTSVIAMSGEVANVNADDPQVGTGPQFRAGEQVRGQQFIPRDAEPRANEVGRASQTYDGETVPGHAITDKNIIFADGPVPNTVDVQAGSAPAFTRGETRDQRNLREYSEGIGANNQPQGLPDNRQRAGGVPLDAQTEAYAKGEPVGELRFFGDKPFATLRMAQASRSGKTPGAKIEEVEGGYAIRMPVEKAPTAEPKAVVTENGLTKDESTELIQRMPPVASASGLEVAEWLIYDRVLSLADLQVQYGRSQRYFKNLLNEQI